MSEECHELKNIKYQTLLLNGNTIDFDDQSTQKDIHTYLDNEQKNNDYCKPWSKLDKLSKIEKLYEYAEIYIQKEKMKSDNLSVMKKYLREALDKKRLQRIKDVVYDKEQGKITNIPGLVFKKQSRKFTLRNQEKRSSTLKNLGRGKDRKKVKKLTDSIKNTKEKHK
jgi:hypothetical protein